MTDATTTASTVTNALAEVGTALAAVESFEPLIETFVPAVSPFVNLFNGVIQAVNTVAADSAANAGIAMTLEDAILAVANHLTPGGAAASALSPTATPMPAAVAVKPATSS